MNRYVRAAAAVVAMVGGAGSVGCVSTGGRADEYRTGGNLCWDPCWPERYNAVARQEVLAPFAQQVHNGQALNQTLWNWHFDEGSDKLNPAGMAKLDSIARTRPSPDSRLYVQAARDIVATPENSDKVVELRNTLTAKRAAAIQKYMGTQPAIHPVAYEVYVHDPVVPGIPSDFATRSFNGQGPGYRGGLTGGAGGTQGTGGGAAPNISGGPTGPGGGGSGGSGGGSGSGPY